MEFNHELVLGLRVVRGPDWEWGDQDGGEGYVGTVAEMEEGGVAVVVLWDAGQRCRYRCGEEGKYDLRILDTGPSSGGLHIVSRVSCDWCQEERIAGLVWRCVRCLDYHLCNQCYMADSHSTRHQFLRLHHKDLNKRLRMPARSESRRLTARGIFPGAQVIRGVDWKWKDQDGGSGTAGMVTAIKDWQTETTRSVVEVQWERKHRRNIYRLGHRGKVDVTCSVPAIGGQYYPDHLPILGVGAPEAGGKSFSSTAFAAGDTVSVQLEVDILRLLQEDHGGWNDTMASVIGQVGMVNFIHSDGDPEIRYLTNHIFKFNAEAISSVNAVIYEVGDAVRVMDDIVFFHELQKEGPGWVDDMALSLGQVGRVTKLTLMMHVQARINGRRWIYNSKCLTQVSEDQIPEVKDGDDEDVDFNARGQLLTLLPAANDCDVIVLAAAAGDVVTMIEHLKAKPTEVNRMVDGRIAVHEACKEGFIGVLKALLEFNPDLEMLDSQGMRPVHVCAYSNCAEAMQLLLDHGADVNSKDASENTALMVASALGHMRVFKVILAHPYLNVHVGGAIGGTALHCAVTARRGYCVRLLLEAGADPSTADFTASTPLHRAAGLGHFPSVERMLMHFPEHINLQKHDNGYFPLHVAVANNSIDIAELLLQQPSSNVDAVSNGQLSALLIAAHEGYSTIVELLVGHGADLKTTNDDNGNTALHLINVRKNMKPITAEMKHLWKVQENLKCEYPDVVLEPFLVVACMLLMEGADLYIKNRIGHSPLFVSPSHTNHVLTTVVQRCGRGTFRGSLASPTTPLPRLSRIQKPTTSTSVAESFAGKAASSKVLGKNVAPATTDSSGVPPANTGSSGLPPATTGSSGLLPATTGSSGLPPATTGSSSLPPATTGNSSILPATIDSSGFPQATTGSSGLLPATTGSSDLLPTTTGSSGLLPATTGSSGLPPKTTSNSGVPAGSTGSSDPSAGHPDPPAMVPTAASAGWRITNVARDETTHPEEDNSCCLCDNVINVQLSPCGHSVMCSHHAGMAKRCPECNEPIQEVLGIKTFN